MAGKAKNMCQRGVISWGEGGSKVRDMVLELSSLKGNSLTLRPVVR